MNRAIPVPAAEASLILGEIADALFVVAKGMRTGEMDLDRDRALWGSLVSLLAKLETGILLTMLQQQNSQVVPFKRPR
jgi:hypothetical protein